MQFKPSDYMLSELVAVDLPWTNSYFPNYSYTLRFNTLNFLLKERINSAAVKYFF